MCLLRILVVHGATFFLNGCTYYHKLDETYTNGMETNVYGTIRNDVTRPKEPPSTMHGRAAGEWTLAVEEHRTKTVVLKYACVRRGDPHGHGRRRNRASK